MLTGTHKVPADFLTKKWYREPATAPLGANTLDYNFYS